MTGRPVFVIHGIANRDRVDIDRRVAQLADGVGVGTIHAVYWGDLGADHRWVHTIIPPVSARARRSVRGEDRSDSNGADELDVLTVALLSGADLTAARSGLDHLLEGVRTELDDATQQRWPVRADPGHLRAWLVDAVEDAWADPEVAWLWNVGDGDLLSELGVGVVRTTMALLSTDDTFEIRSAEQVRRIVTVVLRQADRVVADTAGTAAARFVRWARQHAAPALAMNIGDLLGYHRHRAEIQQRVWQTIAERAGPDAGRDFRHPVHLVGHSLGAVIALDAATAPEHAVHTASIVTFGSHWPLLHLWRPAGTVPRFDGRPVPLPPTIRAWTNLWERLDLMAFLAGPLFVLPDGSRPRDVELRLGPAATLLSHSTYWDSPLLLAELTRAWRAGDHNGR